jgi:hypothetical protein
MWFPYLNKTGTTIPAYGIVRIHGAALSTGRKQLLLSGRRPRDGINYIFGTD